MAVYRPTPCWAGHPCHGSSYISVSRLVPRRWPAALPETEAVSAPCVQGYTFAVGKQQTDAPRTRQTLSYLNLLTPPWPLGPDSEIIEVVLTSLQVYQLL